MPGFLILHHEKEGTSHLWWLLNGTRGISMVHQVDARTDEPFDRYQTGGMPSRDILQCLDIIFSGARDQDRLNRIYSRNVGCGLGPIEANTIPGIKMRYRPPDERDRGTLLRFVERIPRFGPDLAARLHLERHRYSEGLDPLLMRNDCVVFYAVRQDIFRWALSLYHGDGTGKDGHLQFDIATGKRKRSEIPPIHVDPERLAGIIRYCRSTHTEKMQLLKRMSERGIRVAPLLYEQLCEDPPGFLRYLFRCLGHAVSEAEIGEIIATGSMYQKVHSHDISTFVTNHEEISAQFGREAVDFSQAYRDRYGDPPWPDPLA